MQITDAEKKQEQKMFTAVWEFYKKYYTPEGDDKYWLDLVDEGTALCNQFNDHYVVCKLVMAVTEILNKRQKIISGVETE